MKPSPATISWQKEWVALILMMTNTLSCLRSTPAETLVNFNITKNPFIPGGPWNPVIDGVELTDEPQWLAYQGKFSNKVPVMLGTNMNEGSIFNVFSREMGFSNFVAHVDAFNYTSAIDQEIINIYPMSNYSSPWWAYSGILGDEAMTCPARRSARWISDVGQNVYYYFFTHALDEELGGIEGVFHGEDLIFVFDLPNGVYPGFFPIVLSDAEVQLQANFVKYWTTFAASGSPNAPGMPLWPTYNNATDMNINMDETITVSSGLKSQLCDFWDTVFLSGY